MNTLTPEQIDDCVMWTNQFFAAWDLNSNSRALLQKERILQNTFRSGTQSTRTHVYHLGDRNGGKGHCTA